MSKTISPKIWNMLFMMVLILFTLVVYKSYSEHAFAKKKGFNKPDYDFALNAQIESCSIEQNKIEIQGWAWTDKIAEWYPIFIYIKHNQYYYLLYSRVYRREDVSQAFGLASGFTGFYASGMIADHEREVDPSSSFVLVRQSFNGERYGAEFNCHENI